MNKEFSQMTVAELCAIDEISAQQVTAAVRFCLDQAQRASKNYIAAVANGGFSSVESLAALATLRHYVQNAKRLNNR